MAQFSFSLGALQISMDRVAAPRVPTLRRSVSAALTDDGAPVPGPGWFESSWELVRGLDVCEGLPGDAQLHEWIEACLRAGPAHSHDGQRLELRPA